MSPADQAHHRGTQFGVGDEDAWEDDDEEYDGEDPTDQCQHQ